MRSAPNKSAARAIADVGAGLILATVDIAASPERVFQALTSSADVLVWWGAEGAYRTTGWRADVRQGGSWRADGVGNDGQPFHVEGEYLEVDPPTRLVQTWKPQWDGGHETKLTYLLEALAAGTRLTVRHEGFTDRAESCRAHGAGWELVLGWLDGYLRTPSAIAGDSWKYYVVKLLAPRPTFMLDMNDAERATMMAHAAYWQQMTNDGHIVVFGPVADPRGGYGIGIMRVRDEQELERLRAADPAILAPHGLYHEVAPMVRAIVAT